MTTTDTRKLQLSNTQTTITAGNITVSNTTTSKIFKTGASWLQENNDKAITFYYKSPSYGTYTILSLYGNGIETPGLRLGTKWADPNPKTMTSFLTSTESTSPSDTSIPTSLWTQNKLDTKANLTTTYTKTQVDDALALKADKATTYTKEEVYTKGEVDDNLLLYAKKNDPTQTVTAAKFVANSFQGSQNSNNALIFENQNAYFTYPLQVTDSSKTGLKTYSYLDGGNTGYGYLGIWRDSYYPHLSMSKTTTTMNKNVTFSGTLTVNGVQVNSSVFTILEIRYNSTFLKQEGNLNQRTFISALSGSLKLYKFNCISQVTPFNFNLNSNYALIIFRNGTFFLITASQAQLYDGDLYRFIAAPVGNLQYNSIKLSSVDTIDNISIFDVPISYNYPYILPQIHKINPFNFPNPEIQFVTIQIKDSNNYIHTYSFSYDSVVNTYNSPNSTSRAINVQTQTPAFFILCHTRTLATNIFTTRFYWIYLDANKSYNFTSENLSVFKLELNTNLPTNQIYGQYSITISNGTTNAAYNHSFSIGLTSPANISGNPNAFIVTIVNDYQLNCDMFNDKFTTNQFI